MPDFAQVYNFLGGVFDPDTTGHLQKLREMDPIDAETVLQLMKNLSVNLSGPDFETHRRLLSSHGAGKGQARHESVGDPGSTQIVHVPFM
ncbi:hypothetical protein TRIUR3_07929 [Triticum urartu]|uniref:Transcription factor ASG4 n=2 Tax=Triticum TaxID=4564 RepID=M8B3U3_TRIUA|nr:hypothetical protein TRIUR3_07929 [Triticum urartu]